MHSGPPDFLDQRRMGALTDARAPRRRPTTSLRPRRRGFTLVELLQVVLLIAIVAGILAPRIDVAGARADGTVLRIKALLSEAQRRALLRQHDVRVLFDVDGGRVRIHDDADNDAVVDTGERYTTADLGEGTSFGRAGAPAIGGGGGDPVSFPVDPTLELPVLTYHRNGSASGEGTLYIGGGPDAGSTTARALRVERATGIATCWSHRTDGWEDRC